MLLTVVICSHFCNFVPYITAAVVIKDSVVML